MARPFTNKVETGWKRVGKNVQTLWWVELDQLHSDACTPSSVATGYMYVPATPRVLIFVVFFVCLFEFLFDCLFLYFLV